MSQKQLNKNKYENAILYLIQSLGVLRGKKKLAKLLYFVDFDTFEKYEHSVTNETYFSRDMGPLGAKLAEVLEEMQEENKIKIEDMRDADHLQPTCTYQALQQADLSVFSTEEKEILDRVLKKYGNLNGSELQAISHDQAPYIGTELGKEIVYELSIYRGTDFSDSN